jgi:hypothetical protein
VYRYTQGHPAEIELGGFDVLARDTVAEIDGIGL